MLISYFIGNAWANLLPRGDRLESRWREKGGQGKLPRWITVMKFVNNGPWSLKEHSICAITANSASNAAGPSTAFAAQKLFYDIPLNAVTVILTTVSIGLFGYGICGIMRPFAVWHTEAVYWTNLPIVKALQGLHWQQVKDSKPLRWFWYAFTGMSLYEIIPAYIFPWLNSVSIPVRDLPSLLDENSYRQRCRNIHQKICQKTCGKRGRKRCWKRSEYEISIHGKTSLESKASIPMSSTIIISS